MTKPEPMVCPECGDVAHWVYDMLDGEWELDGEWWFDPQVATGGYTCSRRCHLKRARPKEPPADTSWIEMEHG